MSDYYTVEFRIYGEKLDFNKISEDLGLIATTLQKIDEPAYLSKKFEESMWGYGQTEGRGLKEWISLEEGLSSLMKDLIPLKEKIKAYQQHNKTVLWCGHFHENFGSGPTFSNQLLKKIADFELDIILSTYFYK